LKPEVQSLHLEKIVQVLTKPPFFQVLVEVLAAVMEVKEEKATVTSTSLLHMAVSLHLTTTAPQVVPETVMVGRVVDLYSWI